MRWLRGVDLFSEHLAVNRDQQMRRHVLLCLPMKFFLLPLLSLALFVAAACGASTTNPPPDDPEDALTLPPLETTVPSSANTPSATVPLSAGITYEEILSQLFVALGVQPDEAPDRSTADVPKEQEFIVRIGEQIALRVDEGMRQSDETDITYFERRATIFPAFAVAMDTFFAEQGADIRSFAISPPVAATGISLVVGFVVNEVNELIVAAENTGAELNLPPGYDRDATPQLVVTGLLTAIG